MVCLSAGSLQINTDQDEAKLSISECLLDESDKSCYWRCLLSMLNPALMGLGMEPRGRRRKQAGADGGGQKRAQRAEEGAKGGGAPSRALS